MKALTPRNKKISIVLICIILALVVYTSSAVVRSNYPFGESALAGYSFLASHPSTTSTGSIIQYFRENKPGTNCNIKEVVTSSNLENLYSGDITALSIEDSSYQEREAKKGTGKYIFDSKQYTYFAKYCANIIE